MTITTKKFFFNKDLYIKVHLSQLFITVIFEFIILSIIVVIGAILGSCFFAFFCIVIYILIFVFKFINLYIDSRSKDNQSLYMRKYHEIDENFISTSYEDGTGGKLNLSCVINIKKTKEYYLLYMSPTQFIYIPFDAFKSEEDRINFEGFLKNKELKII
ncbi:MAG: YcxB family protein [Cyanobacteriota bacterium]